MIESGSQILTFNSAISSPDLTERVADRPYVALVGRSLVPDERGVAALAAKMKAEHCPVGLGAIAVGPGRLTVPPARIEDLRFREVGATAVTVVARQHLLGVMRDRQPSANDPFSQWRIVRDIAANGQVLKTDIKVGALQGPAEALSLRVPADLAGDRFDKEARTDLILIYGEIDASVSLYFDGLPSELVKRIRYLSPSTPIHDFPHFLAASLVIVVRAFEHLVESGTLDLLETMRIPFAWFVDDNFLSLAEDQDGFEYYSPQRIRDFVARTCGVLASTAALAEAMAEFGRPVLQWPCVFDESLCASDTSERPADDLFTLGAIGGSFRRRDFLETVLPALNQTPREQQVKIYARFDLVRGLKDPRLSPQPTELSFRQFIFRWQNLRCNVVVHPRGDAANMPFKSPATLLVARYLGAVPIVAREPPYSELGPSQGVCVAEPGAASWAKHVRDLSHRTYREELLGNLDAWCRAMFDPANAVTQATCLNAWAVPATTVERDYRLRRALAMPSFERLLKGALSDPLAGVDARASPSILLGRRARLSFLKMARTIATQTGTLEHARRLRDYIFARR